MDLGVLHFATFQLQKLAQREKKTVVHSDLQGTGPTAMQKAVTFSQYIFIAEKCMKKDIGIETGRPDLLSLLTFISRNY